MAKSPGFRLFYAEKRKSRLVFGCSKPKNREVAGFSVLCSQKMVLLPDNQKNIHEYKNK
jgi:hypothetical protein